LAIPQWPPIEVHTSQVRCIGICYQFSFRRTSQSCRHWHHLYQINRPSILWMAFAFCTWHVKSRWVEQGQSGQAGQLCQRKKTGSTCIKKTQITINQLLTTHSSRQKI